MYLHLENNKKEVAYHFDFQLVILQSFVFINIIGIQKSKQNNKHQQTEAAREVFDKIPKVEKQG